MSTTPRSVTTRSATTRSATPRRSSTDAARPSSPSGRGAVPVAPGTNLVVVRGTLRADPERRDLANDDDVLLCDVLVHVDEGPTESVPVLWASPPAVADRLVAATDVVVVGRVRRRFFRVGGATATRTEVHADAIVPVRAGTTVRRALDTALASVGSD